MPGGRPRRRRPQHRARRWLLRRQEGQASPPLQGTQVHEAARAPARGWLVHGRHLCDRRRGAAARRAGIRRHPRRQPGRRPSRPASARGDGQTGDRDRRRRRSRPARAARRRRGVRSRPAGARRGRRGHGPLRPPRRQPRADRTRASLERAPRLTFAGLQGYEGHAVMEPDRARRRELVEHAGDVLAGERERLVSAGLPCSAVSGAARERSISPCRRAC
jgi:hypothetical protein